MGVFVITPRGTSCTYSSSTFAKFFSKCAGDGVLGDSTVLCSEFFDCFQSHPDVGVGVRLIRLKCSVGMSLGLLRPPERPNLPKLRIPNEAFSDDFREDLRSEYQLNIERNGGMICSTRGRSGSKLPQMQADRISMSDHLMTSTLSQVESNEFEYLMTYFRRTMLVMVALETVSSYHDDCKLETAYKDPTLISKITQDFFFVLICSFQTTGNGSNKMIKSSMMLRPAPVNPIAAETGRHFASVIVLSQMDLMGRHWKTTRRKNTEPWMNC